MVGMEKKLKLQNIQTKKVCARMSGGKVYRMIKQKLHVTYVIRHCSFLKYHCNARLIQSHHINEDT